MSLEELTIANKLDLDGTDASLAAEAARMAEMLVNSGHHPDSFFDLARHFFIKYCQALGWTNSKIAEQIKCTPRTVYNHLDKDAQFLESLLKQKINPHSLSAILDYAAQGDFSLEDYVTWSQEPMESAKSRLGTLVQSEHLIKIDNLFSVGERPYIRSRPRTISDLSNQAQRAGELRNLPSNEISGFYRSEKVSSAGFRNLRDQLIARGETEIKAKPKALVDLYFELLNSLDIKTTKRRNALQRELKDIGYSRDQIRAAIKERNLGQRFRCVTGAVWQDASAGNIRDANSLLQFAVENYMSPTVRLLPTKANLDPDSLKELQSVGISQINSIFDDLLAEAKAQPGPKSHTVKLFFVWGITDLYDTDLDKDLIN